MEAEGLGWLAIQESETAKALDACVKKVVAEAVQSTQASGF